jgi:hypothetical protein
MKTQANGAFDSDGFARAPECTGPRTSTRMLDLMRIIGTLFAGVSAYAATLLLLSEGLGIAGGSRWYWIPFIASLSGVVVIAAPWHAWRTLNRIETIAVTLFLAALVLIIDVVGAIWYSCAKGVCL